MGRLAQGLCWLAIAGCADLSPIPSSECGNAVLDPGEDCDVHEDTSLGPGTSCGASDPAGPASCRYVCSDAAAACPSGWDCGQDGICRRPGNELVAQEAMLDWSPHSFELVDFNGDGQIDLVGAFTSHIEFRAGLGEGMFSEGLAVPTTTVTGPVGVGQLDRDAFGDVTLPTQQGLLVWRGQREGPPLQVAYAPYASGGQDRVLLLPVRVPALSDESAVMFLYDELGDFGYELVACVYIVQTGRQQCEVVAPSTRLDEIGARFAVADVDHDGGDEVVFGPLGGARLRIVAVRQDLLVGELAPAGLDGSQSPTLLEVDEALQCFGCAQRVNGLRIERGVAVADVDGDGDPDLMVSVVGPGIEESVLIARGDGAGGFAAPYLDPRFELLKSQNRAADGSLSEAPVWPIAVGHLDGDAIADFVSPHGAFLGAPDSLVQTYARDLQLPWSSALLTDVDGDAWNDVVGVVAGERQVDVVRCVAGVQCDQRAPYRTDLGVTQLRSGSLQGLSARDVVLVESAPEGSGEDDALSVMFGRPDQWPADPVRQGRFHRIEHLEVGRLSSPGPQLNDGFDDLLLSTRTSADELAISALVANGTQTLSSPYFAGSAASVPQRTLVGRFFGGAEPYEDVVLLGRSDVDRPTAWWVRGADDAAFSPTETGLDLRTWFVDSGFDLACARFATGDVNGDGVEEVVALLGSAVCATSAATRVALGQASEGGTVTFELQELGVAEGGDGAEILLADLDSNGFDDLLVARAGSLEVSWAGASGLAPPELLSVLPEERVLELTVIARGAAGTGARRVAVLTERFVTVVSAGGRVSEAASGNARRMRSADVDGDGLGDLLLVGDDGLRFLLATEASPLGGANE